jgi:Zn-dependent protease with chaperone function
VNAAGIALVWALALAAPGLAAMLSDRRTSPRVAAALHLWALIGMAVAPIALLLCLAGPGSFLGGTSHGALEYHAHTLRWVVLGAVGAILAWLSLAAIRTLRATLAADPRRLGVGELTSIPGGVPVYVLPVDRPVAFAAGLRRGQVVVSRGLMDLLSEEERRAAVAHEVAHVRGGHQGLLFVGRVMTQALGVLPPARRAFASLRRELEAAADDHAARAVGDPQIVATAIAKVSLAGPSTAPNAPLADEADLAYRVARLLGRYPESRTRAAVALTLMGVLVIGVVASQCGALHPGALWTGVVACSALFGWIGFRSLRSIRA